MALIRCSECRARISDRAAACPHCGCPVEIRLPKPMLGVKSDISKGKLLKYIVSGFILILIVNSCMQDKKGASDGKTSGVSAANAVTPKGTDKTCSPGTPITSPVLDVTGFGHPVYTLPDAGSEKVLNEKATQLLNSPDYREASAETRVQPFCESGEWRKVRFVDPDWPEIGWVKADILLAPRPAGVPRVYGSTDVLLDDKRMEPNRETLVKAVNRIHTEDTRCGSIVPIVYYSHNKKGKVELNRYFVTCGKGVATTNIHFTLADVKSSKKFSNPMDSAVSQDVALQVCRDSVRRSAKFPSSVDFDFLGSAAETYSDGTTVAQLDFEAKNGFGNLIPQRAICRFPVTGDPSIKIGNR